MSTWNMFDKEIAEEKRIILAYGWPNRNRFPRVDSYKKQALRLMAECELMKDRIDDLERSRSAAIDLLDAVTAEDMNKLNGYGLEKNKSLIRIAKGDNE